MKKVFIVFSLLFLCRIGITQEVGKPFVRNYLPKEYGAHVQNWAIVQDDRGVMYFGNTDGVLEYDGVRWNLIVLSDNRDIARTLAKDGNGRIWVGGNNEMGYLELGEKCTQFVSVEPLLPNWQRKFKDVWEIHCIENDVYFATDLYIFKFSEGSLAAIDSSNMAYGQSFVLDGDVYVPVKDRGLCIVKNDTLVEVSSASLFKENKVEVSLAVNDSTVFLGTKNGIYYYSPCSENSPEMLRKLPSELDKYISKFNLPSKAQQYGNFFYVSTPGEGCFVVDAEGQTVSKIDRTMGLTTNRLHNIYIDKQGFLWIASNNGISKVSIASSISFWDVKDGLDGNVESIYRYDSTLYVGTHQGLFYIENNDIKKIAGLNTTSWTMIPFTDSRTNEEFMLSGTSNGIYRIKNKTMQRLVHSSTYYIYELLQSKFYDNILYACTTEGILVYKYSNGALLLKGMTENFNENIRSIYEIDEHTLWLGTFRNGVVKLTHDGFLKNSQITYYKTEQGLASTKNPIIFPYKEGFVVGSNGGINRYNPTTDLMEPDSTFGSVFCTGEKDVFSFYSSTTDRIWISGLNNKQSETGYLQASDKGKFRWVTKPFKQIPEMLVLGFYVEKNGTTWIGGTEGLFKYSVGDTFGYDMEFNTRIRRITLSNDSIFFCKTPTNGEYHSEAIITDKSPVRIEFKNNSLLFEYAAIFFAQENDNEYSYYLEGFDKQWSGWSKLPFKEYTNLLEGRYAFRVKAKNIFGVESSEDVFYFTILSPWYRSVVAYIMYAIVIVLVMSIILKLNSKRHKAANLRLEKIVMQRTAELSEVNTQLEEQQAELEIRQEEITAQAKVLEDNNRELQKLSIVAKETDNAVLIMDAYTNFQWVNEGFFKLYKTNLSSLMKERGISLLDASQNPNAKEIVDECLSTKTSVNYESFNKISASEAIWIQTTLTPIIDERGEVIKLVAIESDITELKIAQQEIQKQRDKLALLNSTKDKFFSIIAHDLRNPISNIVGLSEILFEKITDGKQEDSVRFAKLLTQTTNTTYELVDNLLTWSRSQSGKMQFRPDSVDIKEVVDSIVKQMEGAAHIKGIKLLSTLTDNIQVFVDNDMILTVLRNLVTNAIKFSSDGDKITLSASVDAKVVTVCVFDTGVGISEKVIDKLFKIDGNVKSEGTANEPGTGLGLILCREFIEKNDGEIWVESTEGEGSTFCFTLPMVQA